MEYLLEALVQVTAIQQEQVVAQQAQVAAQMEQAALQQESNQLLIALQAQAQGMSGPGESAPDS